MLPGGTDVDRGDIAEDHISDTGISSFTRIAARPSMGRTVITSIIVDREGMAAKVHAQACARFRSMVDRAGMMVSLPSIAPNHSRCMSLV
ncbi:hypothetical protein [Ochrobactrum sp. RH2CCR150]|uniref:hypothetical protein n=1 Tax=Ochrobactrum sp. RH2CCR150 TaxID=2587044 RepID=UPI0015FA1C82|nr:hypothetical protein [Ochrobactrum sp. RH2CCR150]